MNARLRISLLIFALLLAFFTFSAGVFAVEDDDALAEGRVDMSEEEYDEYEEYEEYDESSTDSFSSLTADADFPYSFVSPYTGSTYSVPVSSLTLGVDVSRHNGSIDWKKAANSGVQFAIIRVAYRGYSYGTLNEDSRFRENIAGAQAAGIKVGVYIYSQATTKKEAEEEAAYLLKRIGGYDLELPVVLDYEFYKPHEGILAEAYDSGKLNKESATDVCLAFCNYVNERGYSPMVYANASMLTNYLNYERLHAKTDIWLAKYSTTPRYSGRSFKDVEFWQYTSSGTVNGISGSADCNFGFSDKIYNYQNGALPFYDVRSNVWYYDQLVTCYERGLFAGIDAHHFAPNRAMNRAMLVTVLYRMEGSPAAQRGATFTDLTSGWYRDAVNWVAENGIVAGFSSEIFGPTQDISREDLASILYRYAEYKGYDISKASSLSGFGDSAAVSAYAVPAMEWAVACGYISGFPDKTLRPQENASRAQVASILARFVSDH